MSTFTLKNIPPELYDRLKESAKTNRRSINNEIIASLERAYRAHLVDPEQFLTEVRQLREKFGDYRTNDDEINQAKNEGRP